MSVIIAKSPKQSSLSTCLFTDIAHDPQGQETLSVPYHQLQFDGSAHLGCVLTRVCGFGQSHLPVFPVLLHPLAGELRLISGFVQTCYDGDCREARTKGVNVQEIFQVSVCVKPANTLLSKASLMAELASEWEGTAG